MIRKLLSFIVVFVGWCSAATAQNVPELMYFKFDAATGGVVSNDANPATRVSLSGNLQGATVGGVGQFNTALQGTGAATATNSLNANWPLNLSGPWTISMWFSGVTNALTSNYLWGGSGGSTFRAMTGSGLVSGAGNIRVRATGMPDVDFINIFDATGTPVVIHMVYDPSVSSILTYINGVAATTYPQATALTLTGTDFTVGGQAASAGLNSGGRMDEFRMYNRAVPATEIAATWNQPLPMTPCSGKPLAGTTTPAGPLSTCIGGASTLTTTGYTLAQNITFQWEESTNGGTTWTSILGANANTYTATPTVNTMYRMVTTCTNSNDTAIANAVTINVPPPVWGTIPYFQNFETWINNCGTNDIPSSGAMGNVWVNGPPTGNNSWRRFNQGSSAGWTNPTSAPYNPQAWPSNLLPAGGSARFHSSEAAVGVPGNLDLYLDCSGVVGDKQLYFYHNNPPTAAALGVDSLNIWLSVNGSTFIPTPLASYDTTAPNEWRRRSISIASNSPNTIIRFQGKRNLSIASGNTDMGIDSVMVVGPCSGTPAPGSIVGVPTVLCAGGFANLSTMGTTLGGGMSYVWEQSVNGTTGWVNAVGGSGANTQFYTTPSLYDTMYYRMRVGCGANNATTAAVRVDVKSPSYASVPYVQNFETWITPSIVACGAFALPDTNWANWQPTGNNSWRRHNQGNNAAWTTWTAGQYTQQVGISGTQSARFHSTYAPAGSAGHLELLVNCSQQTGDKQLEFHYRNDNAGNDSMEVLYSVDSGFSFAPLTKLYTTTGWAEYRIPLVSNSPKTIVRFKAYSDYSNSGTDICIDSVRVVEPCTAPVTAGTINAPASACKNAPFLLYLMGNTSAAGLTYNWESSPDNAIWTSIGTSHNLTTTITQPTFFRATVTCAGASASNTTPVVYVDTTQFYYCYCANGATVTTGADVGNVLIESLPGTVVKLNSGTVTTVTNNGTANKTYTDYRYSLLPPAQQNWAQLYWDTTYRLAITQINNSAFTAAQATVWIDKDHSGTFDANEVVLQKPTSASSMPPQVVDTTFKLLLSDIDTGITGMRVQIEEGTTPTSNPCINYTGGETEDYLIRIFFPPCDGPPNAGTAIISDSFTCVGYKIFVTDTSYEKKKSNLRRIWQQSPDSLSWANIAGSDTLDQVPHIVTAKTYFRMRLICATPVKLDTSYSNVVKVDITPPISCYCLSYADGLTQDTSDVGEFIFETYSNSVGGPHLKNPAAWRLRTDYTSQTTPNLWIDSTYDFSLYHIMSSATHADAKITIFIDYDADMKYEAPQELVYTGYTGASNYYIQGSFKIPANALPDLATGMRVILNNDVGPNVPSDQGCGLYTSGETEDYVVIIRSPLTSVNTVRSIGHYNLFPNPTEGRFTVSFTMLENVENATLTVTNVVGAEIMRKDMSQIKSGSTYEESLDLSKMARGVYMVTLRAGQERIIRKLVVQ